MNQENGGQVLLIGATNRIEAIDTALRRAGRFDKEICLGIPDEKSRQRILEVICRNLRLAPGFDLGTLAKLTPGYVGADLQLLVREAAVQAVNKALMDTTQKRAKADSKKNKQKAEAKVQLGSVLISPEDPTTVPIAESSTETSVVEESICDNDVTNKKTTEPVAPTEPPNQDAPPPTESSVTEVPDSTNVDAPNGNTDNAVENPKVMDVEAEEKMEVDVDKPQPDTASIDATIEVVENSGEIQNQKDDILATSQVSDKVDDEEPEDEPEAEPETAPYLRWIKETAPLSSSQLDELYIFIDGQIRICHND